MTHGRCRGSGPRDKANGVFQQRPADHHDVNQAIPDYCVRLLRRSDIPAGRSGKTGFPPHPPGDIGKKARSPGDGRGRRIEAHRHIEEVEPLDLHRARQRHGLHQHLLVAPVELNHPETCGQWQVLRPDLANVAKRLQQETAALGGRAAIFILALVGVDREETLAEIAMREVKLQPLKANISRPLCGGNEVTADAVDILLRHLLRHARQIGAECDGGRSDRRPCPGIARRHVVIAFPRAVGAGLSAGMGDLNARHRTSGLDRRDNRPKCLGLCVGPQPCAAGRDAAFRRDSSRLHDQQAGAATGQRRKMDLVPFVDNAFVSGVLAHGGYGDPVAQCHALQGIGLE